MKTCVRLSGGNQIISHVSICKVLKQSTTVVGLISDSAELIVPSRYFCGGSFRFMSWCLKKILCCWRLMYVFIFLVKLR